MLPKSKKCSLCPPNLIKWCVPLPHTNALWLWVCSYFMLCCPQGDPSLLIVKHAKKLGIHYLLLSVQKGGQPDACPLARAWWSVMYHSNVACVMKLRSWLWIPGCQLPWFSDCGLKLASNAAFQMLMLSKQDWLRSSVHEVSMLRNKNL